jgi:hypothetical protein
MHAALQRQGVLILAVAPRDSTSRHIPANPATPVAGIARGGGEEAAKVRAVLSRKKNEKKNRKKKKRR